LLAQRLHSFSQLNREELNRFSNDLHVTFRHHSDCRNLERLAGDWQRSHPNDLNSSPRCLAEARSLSRVSAILTATWFCTSHVERVNLTVRMRMRRLTRLTNAFSRKWENLKAAVALFVFDYNFRQLHGSLRCTPAMAAGVASTIWTWKDLFN